MGTVDIYITALRHSIVWYSCCWEYSYPKSIHSTITMQRLLHCPFFQCCCIRPAGGFLPKVVGQKRRGYCDTSGNQLFPSSSLKNSTLEKFPILPFREDNKRRTLDCYFNSNSNSQEDRAWRRWCPPRCESKTKFIYAMDRLFIVLGFICW